MGYGNTHRQRAAALGAADAKTLLLASLPFVLATLTPAQLEQAQRVMDAAVLNPVVKKQYDDLMKKSIRAQSGNVIMRDENIVREADKAWEMMIYVHPADYSIRLDFTKLLEPDAFTPETDNPDEAAYLQKVRSILTGSGVWLRIGQPQVSAFVVDPRVFQVWLSVGPDGDNFFTIPTKNGQLTQEALFNTKTFGAGYSRDVNHGYVREELRREMDRLERQINDGIMQHNILSSDRRRAFIGVTAVSDALGGASFPDISIWNYSHRMLIKAREASIGGRNMTAARAYLLAAAAVTRNAAHLIAEYIDDTSSGAGKAVAILNVAKTAGEIAEIGLAITGGAAVIRGGTKAAASGTKMVVTRTEAEVDILLEKEFSKAIAKDPSLAADLKSWPAHVPGPAGTVNRSTSGAPKGLLTPRGYR
ncbi:MAG: hypothetical protein HOP17_16580 [Acidobacteria bacterium]|nr:hypothetical protein [Acidobacteriota bacterium]